MGRPLPARRLPFSPLSLALPTGTTLWRVHRPGAAASDFGRSTRATRFGPLFDPAGAPIPLWYGASDADGAVSGSVFHDVPIGARYPRIYRGSFVDRLLSPVRTTADLRLTDLTSDLSLIHI